MLYGEDIGSLLIKMNDRIIGSMMGNMGQRWRTYEVQTQCRDEDGCELSLEGVIGTGSRGDIALRYFRISQSLCYPTMKCDFDESSYAGCSLVERHERQPIIYSSTKPKKKYEQTFDSKVAANAELAWIKQSGVNGNTIIHATRHKTETSLPDSWIFYDFKIGNECISCPNGIKIIKNETITKDHPYVVGLVLCSATEFQIFLSEQSENLDSMFYPISVDSPNDSPCELIGETGGNSIEWLGM